MVVVTIVSFFRFQTRVDAAVVFRFSCCFLCAHPICDLRTVFFVHLSLPRRTSGPGSPSRLFSPLPTTVHGFVCIAETLTLSSLFDQHRLGHYVFCFSFGRCRQLIVVGIVDIVVFLVLVQQWCSRV